MFIRYLVVEKEMINLWKRMWKIRIFNFMVIGGCGFILNLCIYYPLTVLIHNKITFLNQIFYLPALLITAPITIAFNYWMNKKWTFKDSTTKSLSLGRYELMGLSTMIFDLFIISGMCKYLLTVLRDMLNSLAI